MDKKLAYGVFLETEDEFSLNGYKGDPKKAVSVTEELFMNLNDRKKLKESGEVISALGQSLKFLNPSEGFNVTLVTKKHHFSIMKIYKESILKHCLLSKK